MRSAYSASDVFELVSAGIVAFIIGLFVVGVIVLWLAYDWTVPYVFDSAIEMGFLPESISVKQAARLTILLMVSGFLWSLGGVLLRALFSRKED